MNREELKYITVHAECNLVCFNQWLPRRLLFGKTHNHGWKSHLSAYGSHVRFKFPESRTLGRVRKFGGKFHRKLNISSSPIANKYHEGKVKRTLKRELKVPEIAEREANGTSVSWWDCCVLKWVCAALTQVVWCALIWMCVVLLALRVNVSLELRKTQGTW